MRTEKSEKDKIVMVTTETEELSSIGVNSQSWKPEWK